MLFRSDVAWELVKVAWELVKVAWEVVEVAWEVVDEIGRCHAGLAGFDPWSRKIPHAVEQLSPCATTTEPAL